MYKPAYQCLEIQQRISNTFLRRIKAGTAYADLTGYAARAQIWNPGRTVLFQELTISWLNRIIVDPNTDWHFSMTLGANETLLNTSDAIWDLLIVNPSGTEIYLERGPVTYSPGYTD